jgi:FAD/FMN-containing dehydrogenase/Fe-S oxidoreductase
MDQERERIQEDLRGLLEGEVRCDAPFVQLYGSDASVYEILPLGVVRPRSVEDIQACLRYASEHGLPVHARGAGTGLAGQSLGPGLVIDFSHSLRRVLNIEDDRVRVQPGVVLSQLNRQLAERGRVFGPDPSTRSVTTMGSVVAINASGSHFPLYGAAHDHVVSIDAVLANGERVVFKKHPIQASHSSTESETLRSIVRRVRELLVRNAELVEKYRPKTMQCDAGYYIWDVLDESKGEIDLARILVGSEGTLAISSELELRTQTTPEHRGLALIFFDRMEAAAHGALEVEQFGADTCDMMDRRLLSIARETDPRYARVLPSDAESMLLVEMSGDDPNEIRDRLKQLTNRLQRRKKLAFDSRTTLEKGERDLYWRLARRVIPLLYRLEGSTRPLPFVEDIIVPPAMLPEFLRKVQNVLKTHAVTASVFAHASHGQLHIRPFLDLANPDDVRRMRRLADELYAAVAEVEGSVSGEHGDGLSRTWYVRKHYGPLYDVLREIKRIFDPQNLLNPGKVVADAPPPLTNNLRPVVSTVASGEAEAVGDEETDANSELPELPARPFTPFLTWDAPEVALAARGCNGCGRCRTQSPQELMCPIFRFAPREEASPRSKANLVRAVVTGKLATEELTGESLKSIADLCVNCHQCRVECPASVDIPKLVFECKAQYVAVNGLRMRDWLMTRVDWMASWAIQFRTLANWALGNRSMRWLLERIAGVAKGRKLPRFAPRSFLSIASRRRLTRPRRGEGRKIVYFVDTYANWFDTQLGEALLAVMGHNGVSVYVPPNLQSSGMPAISMGALDAARRTATRNIAVLAEAVRQGYHVVASEPAAALAIKHEYLNILDDDDARLVAQNTSEACEYLWSMHLTGNLELDLKPINYVLGYHEPCHVRALSDQSAGRELLRLIPGLSVDDIQKGCSGMAGLWGAKSENYRNSLRAGWGLISELRGPRVQLGATECSACKIQMEQGTSKPTLHPLKILALAYGLMPEIAERLSQRGEEFVVT